MDEVEMMVENQDPGHTASWRTWEKRFGLLKVQYEATEKFEAGTMICIL